MTYGLQGVLSNPSVSIGHGREYRVFFRDRERHGGMLVEFKRFKQEPKLGSLLSSKIVLSKVTVLDELNFAFCLETKGRITPPSESDGTGFYIDSLPITLLSEIVRILKKVFKEAEFDV